MISDMTKAYLAVIPSIKEQIGQSKDLQAFIVASLLDMPRDLLFKFFTSIVGEGGGGGSSAGGGTTIGEHEFLSPQQKEEHRAHGHAAEVGLPPEDKCIPIRRTAQELYKAVQIAYDALLKATTRNRNFRKQQLDLATRKLNTYMASHTECLSGWEPQF